MRPYAKHIKKSRPSSREDAGVIMGVTAEGTPIGLRVDPDEELEMEE